MTASAYKRTLKVFAETRDELPLSAKSGRSDKLVHGTIALGVNGYFALNADLPIAKSRLTLHPREPSAVTWALRLDRLG